MTVSLTGKDFLTLEDFTPEEIRHLLDLSKQLKAKKAAGTVDHLLSNKNIVLIFEKASTRTRCAFEVAAFDEGARVTTLTNSHFGKKESVEDSAQVLCRYYDGIQFRGYSQKDVVTLADNANIPVWNGLTDDCHPTQLLADMLTIEEHVNKPLDQIKVVYVGDAHNNMGNSWMVAAAKMGMHFVGFAAQTGGTINFEEKIDIAVKDADIIYTDVWASMGDEDKLEDRIEKLNSYKVTQSMLDKTGNPDVKFMHCLPAFHDKKTEMGRHVCEHYTLKEMEVTDEVFRSKNSIVFDQAENRLHTIKAVMVATLI
jgi:ornithine carbamoyltransferase